MGYLDLNTVILTPGTQIQPHFLYNALQAIMAIDGNPDETIEAIGDFGKYLRENLDVITSGDMERRPM